MNAPPGVDSDSSDEEISPISSPAASPIKPKFSLKSLFIPTRSTPTTPVSANTETAPSSQADPDDTDDQHIDNGGKSHLAKLKRRVRILAGGDQKPTTNKGDQVEDTPKDDEQEQVEDEKDQAAVEMLTLLRQLVAQSRLDIPNSAKVLTSDPPTPVLTESPEKAAEPAPNPEPPSELVKPTKKTRPRYLLKPKPTPKPERPKQQPNGASTFQNVLERRPDTGSPGLNDTYFHPEHHVSGPPRSQQSLSARPDQSQGNVAAPDNPSIGQQTQQPYSAPPWQAWHAPQNGQNQPTYHPAVPQNYPPPMYPHPPALQPWHPSHGYGPAQTASLAYLNNYPHNMYDPYNPSGQGYGYQTMPHPPSAPPFQPPYTQGGTSYNHYSPQTPAGPTSPPWSQHPYLPPQSTSYGHPQHQYHDYPPAPQRNGPATPQPPWSPVGQFANPWSPINGPYLRSEGLRLRPVNRQQPELGLGPDVSSIQGSIRRSGQPDRELETARKGATRMGSVIEVTGGERREEGRMEAEKWSKEGGRTNRPRSPDEGRNTTISSPVGVDKDEKTGAESLSDPSVVRHDLRDAGEETASPRERVETMDPRDGKTYEGARSKRQQLEDKGKPEVHTRSKVSVRGGFAEKDLKEAKVDQAQRAVRREKARISHNRETDKKASGGPEYQDREARPPSNIAGSMGSASEQPLSEREKAKRNVMLKAEKARREAAGDPKRPAEGMLTGKDGGERSDHRPEHSLGQRTAADKERAKRAAMLKATTSQRRREEEAAVSKPEQNGQGAAERRSRQRVEAESARKLDEPFAGILTSRLSKSTDPPSEILPTTPTSSTIRRKATEPDWTKALISLAICIDLGYTQFQRHTRKADEKTGTNDVLVKLVVGLAKTLSGGKDIPTAFEAVFGDRASGEIFARELQNVAAFIAHSSVFDHKGSGGKSEDKSGKTRHLIDLLLSNDKVHSMLQGLSIGRYITPGIVGIVKDLAGKWMKDELSLKIVLRSVLAIRKELDHPTKPQTSPQQQSLLDHLAVVLSKQLKHQSADIPVHTPAKPSRDKRPSRTESTTPKSVPPQLRPIARLPKQVTPVEDDSSDSVYSDPESPGTRDSDEEADRLLAVADSGPRAVPVREERVRRDRPGREQVKAAKEVLMQE